MNDPEARVESAGLIRTLVDRIVLTPEMADGRKQPSIDLIGALAGILALSGNEKAVQITPDGLQQIALVAGARNPREVDFRMPSVGCRFSI